MQTGLTKLRSTGMNEPEPMDPTPQMEPDPGRPARRGPLVAAAIAQCVIGGILLMSTAEYLVPPDSLASLVQLLIIGLLFFSGTVILNRRPWCWWAAVAAQVPLLLYGLGAFASIAHYLSTYNPREDRHGEGPAFAVLTLFFVVPLLLSACAALLLLLRLRTREDYGVRLPARELPRPSRRAVLLTAGAAAVAGALYLPARKLLLGYSLWDAVWAKNTGRIPRLIREGADVNSRDARNGWTPLIAAADNGMDGVAQVLLEQGANVNARDVWGGTPLTAAAENGHVQIVKLLLDRGADPNVQVDGGGTALSQAATGKKEIIALLLAHGANANLVDKYGTTPLMQAVQAGDQAAVRLLVKEPGRVQTTGAGHSAGLFRAVLNQDAGTCRKLLAAGADPNVADSGGFTPVMGAAAFGDLPILSALLNAGARADAKDRSGQTALHWAVMRNQVPAARLLLEHGADVNAADKVLHETPLYRAAEHGRADLVRLLLRYHADVTIRDSLGDTPLQQAQLSGGGQVVTLLQQAERQAPRPGGSNRQQRGH